MKRQELSVSSPLEALSADCGRLRGFVADLTKELEVLLLFTIIYIYICIFLLFDSGDRGAELRPRRPRGLAARVLS